MGILMILLCSLPTKVCLSEAKEKAEWVHIMGNTALIAFRT